MVNLPEPVAAGRTGHPADTNLIIAAVQELDAGKSDRLHASQHAAGSADAVQISMSQVTGLADALAHVHSESEPAGHPITAAAITDSTATGRAVLTGDAAAGRAALAVPLPHRFQTCEDMLWPPRYLATGTAVATLGKDNVYLKLFQATNDVVVTGMSMATGSSTAASGQTLTRFCLYHVGDLYPTGGAARYSFTPVARTASDTTLFASTNTLYTKSWDTTGGWPAGVRLRRGEWYAAGWLLLGGTPPQVISSAALMRSQPSGLHPILSGRPGGIGTPTDLFPYFGGSTYNFDGCGVNWVGLQLDPASVIADAKPTVLLGDSFFSSYAGWFGWGNAQSGATLVPVNNAGVGGQEIPAMTARVGTDVTPYAPEVVVLHGGVNDIANGASTATMQARYTACLDALLAIPTVTDVVVCTPPPAGGITGGEITVLSEVRAWLLSLNRAGVTVADTGMAMSTGDGTTSDAAKVVDGVHPNLVGQQAMADVLDNVLAAL